MTPEQKLLLQAHRLLGEYIGTLEGVLLWDIPEKLKDKLRTRLTELQKVELPTVWEHKQEDLVRHACKCKDCGLVMETQ